MWIFLYSFFSIVLVRKKRMKKGRKWIFLIFFIWTYATHNIYIYSYCLPGKFHGQMSLVGYHPWDHKKLDTTEHQSPPTYIVLHIYIYTHTHTHTHTHTYIYMHTSWHTYLSICVYTYQIYSFLHIYWWSHGLWCPDNWLPSSDYWKFC